MDKIKRILIISSDINLRDILQFCLDGWGYEVYVWSSYNDDINSIKLISPDVIIIDVHSAKQSDLKICNLIKEDFFTAFIPVITLINKRHLRMHLLNLKHGIDDYLIKPPDPLDLRVRIEMALRRSQYSFYASPLTRLPGGWVIDEVLKEKIKENKDFSFGYVDIDNFKYFNDVYGYLKGDYVIMHTAYILYDTIKKYGNRDDFIGHIGGDDFVFITTLDKQEDICKNLISLFDRVIGYHYHTIDREREFIIAKDRTRRLKKIPLMSLSVAVVNRDKNSGIDTPFQINRAVSEIKTYLKSIEGSKFMTERRNCKINNSFIPNIFKRENSLYDYKPLGQILLEKNILSEEQLLEALGIHWRRGIILGEVLKGLGFVKEEKLKELLDLQKREKSVV
ncbi:MAG: diguanylate cyclase [Candidatus Omnitrophica bacterium]|nr:diguanylate cyclase [Candidatus Omnitrophota bacterium]MCM8826741.1 diguanylate cyclase [Candidatus Omnitrophota bacterium]